MKEENCENCVYAEVQGLYVNCLKFGDCEFKECDNVNIKNEVQNE